MHLAKKEINVTKKIARKNIKLTVDDNINVPDIKDDIERIVMWDAKLIGNRAEAAKDKIKLVKEIGVSILYASSNAEGDLDSMDSVVVVEEIVNVDNVDATNKVKVKSVIEDLSISLINSRKVAIKGIIGVDVDVTEDEMIYGASDIENGEKIQCLYKTINETEKVVSKYDECRIKDSIELSANKPNIYDIVWKKVSLGNVTYKPRNNSIELSGELQIFIVYLGKEEQMPVQYITTKLPFTENIECPKCQDNMIGDIDVTLGKVEVIPKPDADGEVRVLEVDAHLQLDINIYEDKEYKVLSDMYSPTVDIDITRVSYPNNSLIVKNNAKDRVQERVVIENSDQKILQICYVDGEVKVDDTKLTKDGVSIEGVIDIGIAYITDDDKHPISSYASTVPFGFVVEGQGMDENTDYKINAKLEQINAIMVSGEEVEIKAVVNTDFIAFSNKEQKAITDIEIKPIDYTRINELPGITGYIVKPEDTLWGIAKTYYSTVESIVQINELEKEEVQPGDKLVIVKG